MSSSWRIDAERVDVAPPVDPLAARLLGRHVPELALDDAAFVSEEVRLRDAEVGNLDDPLEAEKDVLRRHVAVHDVERRAALFALVRVVQPLAASAIDVRADPRRDARLRFRGAHQLAEVEALDVLHREKEPLVAVVLELVDLDDVRVVEARRELRLFDEHRSEAPRGAVRGEDPLDDEDLVGALRASLLGEENLRHAAGPETADDLELAELGGKQGR